MGGSTLLRSFFTLLGSLLWLQAEEPVDDLLPEIRSLSPEIIEELGQELYRRDQWAWKATDAMLAQYPESKAMALQGWVTQPEASGSRVYFIRSSPGGDGAWELAYLVEFGEEDDVKVIPRLGEPLPEEVALRFQARKTAIEAMPGFYNRRYNIEVLDDPEDKGFLVYVMVATEEEHEMVIGGHVRITVSTDGREAKRVDELSRSLLIIDKRQAESEKAVATVVSHIVSPTPVETHIFNTLLHHQPLHVVTGPGEVWMVERGRMKYHRFPSEQEE